MAADEADVSLAVRETLAFFSLTASDDEEAAAALPFADGSTWQSWGSKRGVDMLTRSWQASASAFSAYRSVSGRRLACPAGALAERIYCSDYAFWKAADDACLEYRTVAELPARGGTRAKINYIQQKLPFPVWNRDFCSLIVLAQLPPLLDPAFDGAWVVVWRRASHPDVPDYAARKIQRGVVTIGGFLLQPLDGGAACRVHRFFHSDPKGSLPAWLVDFFVTSELVDMVEAVEQLANE